MEVEEQVTDVKVDMTISRGDRPEPIEAHVDLADVENLPVQDQDGNEFRFGDLYKDKKTIVIFLRHFLCFMAKEYMDDLATVPKKYLDEANVNMVVIGCGHHKFIRPFRRATWYRGPLFVDPERQIYSKMGLPTKSGTPGKTRASKHIKSSFVMGVLRSTWRGMQFRELQGDMNQQGGSFILGPGNVLHFHHQERSPVDHMPINDLLCLAGVPQVNFEKDTRVMTI